MTATCQFVILELKDQIAGPKDSGTPRNFRSCMLRCYIIFASFVVLINVSALFFDKYGHSYVFIIFVSY